MSLAKQRLTRAVGKAGERLIKIEDKTLRRPKPRNSSDGSDISWKRCHSGNPFLQGRSEFDLLSNDSFTIYIYIN